MPAICRGIIYGIYLNRIIILFLNMKKFLILFLVVLTACHANRPTEPFKILKVVNDKAGAKIDVQVNIRLSKQQLIAIAAKIKGDSSQYNNLQFDYLLPGNSYKNTGGVSVYATAIYHDKAAITPADTVKDADDNQLNFEFIGFTSVQAKKLLAFDHAEMATKAILGKFIDDGTKTISIIYQDRKETNQVYILELDTLGKVVSATAPMAVTTNGIRKFVVSQQGDYMTLKDSILTLYSSDAPENRFGP